VLDVEAGAVVSSRSFRYGDPEAAFAAAEHRVEASFRFPRCSSTPIECYAVLAEWTGPPARPRCGATSTGPS
jgi:2-furoyl-CoA dehydrogenase large subunit